MYVAFSRLPSSMDQEVLQKENFFQNDKKEHIQLPTLPVDHSIQEESGKGSETSTSRNDSRLHVIREASWWSSLF